MKNRWRYSAGVVFILLALLAAVLLSAGSWLESESGRNLLQRELSKVLGLEADFRGEYSLKLFPVIRIAGSDLYLSDVGTGLPVVSAESYELHLALRPLLLKEVNILKVEIQDGILDLDRMAEFNASRATQTGSDFQLPVIRDLKITNLRLQQSAADFLLISELNLEDFAEGQKSQIVLDLALNKATVASQAVHLEGILQVTGSPFEMKLFVEELSLQLPKQSWSLGQGELNWSTDQKKLWGELRGSLATYSSRYQLSVLAKDILQMAISVELQSADNESLAIDLEAHNASDRWVLDTVDLNLDGQVLGGAGCFSTNGEPLLQLILEAEQLDVDALQNLIPKELFPPDRNAKGEASASPIAEDSGLPLQLAIAISAEELIWSGAKVRSTRLLVGAEPECSLAEDTALN